MYEEEDDETDQGCQFGEMPASALGYLQSIYRNPSEPESRRMRAAIAALPFESPKLAVTAYLNEGDLGERLDRAIERSFGRLRVINHRPADE
jgi:hypothetical protein